MGKYAAITVNERLYEAGLMDAFDRAAIEGDRKAMITILGRVELDEKEAGFTADAILAHPTRNGRIKP
jgi:hypothetical protein